MQRVYNLGIAHSLSVHLVPRLRRQGRGGEGQQKVVALSRKAPRVGVTVLWNISLPLRAMVMVGLSSPPLRAEGKYVRCLGCPSPSSVRW